MNLDDFGDSEVAIAVAVTGLILSPKARALVRSVAVGGVAELLRAGRSLTSTPPSSDAADDGLEDIVARPETADARPGKSS